ncbi:MAG: hypothetical protein PHC41_03390 [Lachnospiraceae bacterium]|nr:hypothetical protein [Lachnospiraceae bacterium]MDD3615251.1 hypothetical protein [Lachnospiraceae bacterium]
MDYNLNGIYYEIFKCGIVLPSMGLLILVWSKFWNSKKRKKIEFLFGIAALVLSFVMTGNYLKKLNNVEIIKCQGTFFEEYNESKHFFEREYTFIDNKGKKQFYYLDLFSKKKIFSPAFIENDIYEIYYDKGTNIIVKIEKLE